MPDAAHRIETIFTEAVRIRDADQRQAYLSAACGDDAELRGRVEALLKAHDEAGNFMAAPDADEHADPSAAHTLDTTSQTFDTAGAPGIPIARPRGAAGDTALAEKPGAMVGRYKLLQQIGEGGFGVVYMAEQQEPVKRRVALKIIKAGMDTKAVIARFEAERQALAMMDHPNIARVLDAGATDTGRPYFVMELVKGISITDYCDQANLDTRQRLDLFKDVCSAVQHAHQKGVIHRDLKPSNIMVTLHDGKPVVKVIDFGIAKATEQKLTEKTLFTQFGQMIGTPTYMSPEQAVMSGLDVDTRSDVYSLGVMLYELLTGSPPFDAQTLRTAGYDEMRRIIREQEPPKPSTRLSTLAQEVKLTIAAKRHVSPAALSKQLHGDLDWIVMKALEKDRTRRYESASAFAQDIQRHMDAEPVSAAAPSAGYKLRKFVRRNKGPMTAAAVVALLLIGGTVVSAWLAVRATIAERDALTALADKDEALKQKDEALGQKDEALGQRDEAVTSARQAMVGAEWAAAEARKRLSQVEKANEILGSIFENLSPRKIAMADQPLQAILLENLDHAVAQLGGESIGDPIVVAGMQVRFAKSLTALGEARKAIVLLEKARATYEARLGPDHPATLKVLFRLAVAYREDGQHALAGPLLKQTLDRMKTALGEEDPFTLACMAVLGEVHGDAGRFDQAVPMLKRALELRTKVLGPDDAETLATMNNLANVYAEAGRFEDAVPMLEQAFRQLSDKLGLEHPDTIAALSNLAHTYHLTGQRDRAIDLGEQALKLSRARFGPDHPGTLTIINNLAIAYQKAGKVGQAVLLFEQVYRLKQATAGPDHPHTLHSMSNLAAAYWRARRLDKSIPLFEQTLKLQISKLGPQHPHTLQTKLNLGVNYKDAGRFAEAIPLLEEGYKAAAKLPQFRWVVGPLLEAYAKGGQRDKFDNMLQSHLAATREGAPAESPELAGHLNVFARTLLSAETYPEAEALLRESLAIRQKTKGDDWEAFDTRSMLGGALLGQKKYDEAEPLLLAGYEGMKQREQSIPTRYKPVLTESLERLVTLYEKRNAEGDTDKAAMYRKLLDKHKTEAAPGDE